VLLELVVVHASLELLVAEEEVLAAVDLPRALPPRGRGDRDPRDLGSSLEDTADERALPGA
jgi:hypothetical protein